MKKVTPSKTVVLFFLLTYIVSWLVWLPLLIAGKTANIPILVLGMFAPSMLGIMFLYRTQPLVERQELWKRLSPSRIPWRWMLVCLLVLPALFVIGGILEVLAGGHTDLFFTGFSVMWKHPNELAFMLLALVVAGPITEEFGWRGFALDQLQYRYNSLIASFILGIVWVGWHIPLFFIPGTVQYSTGLGGFGFFAASILTITFIITWVYNHTKRSILAAMILHFVFNATHAFAFDHQHPFTAVDWSWRLGVLVAFAVAVSLWDFPRCEGG